MYFVRFQNNYRSEVPKDSYVIIDTTIIQIDIYALRMQFPAFYNNADNMYYDKMQLKKTSDVDSKKELQDAERLRLSILIVDS